MILVVARLKLLFVLIQKIQNVYKLVLIIIIKGVLHAMNNRLGCRIIFYKDCVFGVEQINYVINPIIIELPKNNQICCPHHGIGIVHIKNTIIKILNKLLYCIQQDLCFLLLRSLRCELEVPNFTSKERLSRS